MTVFRKFVPRFGRQGFAASVGALLLLVAGFAPGTASAVPAFARQTGQNCVACHAGGQFPELTPYGRMFKMTGYTIGQRVVPLAVMAAGSISSVKNSDGLTGADRNGLPKFDVASVFIAGKITDNIGGFAQITYDPTGGGQDANGDWIGHTGADNIDIRYADRLVSARHDFLWGVSLNNNPSVSDPWNTAAAWMQYVPAAGYGSNAYLDANAPYPGNSTDSNVAGLTAYAFWNRTIYGELGFYRSSDGLLSFMSAGSPGNVLRGNGNPYWRLAYNREWGANSLMVGASGMTARIFDSANAVDPSVPESYYRMRSVGVDAQYQYLLDPHTITAQLAYQQQAFTPSAVDAQNNGTAFQSTDVFRAKASYVYNAKYGAALAVFNQTGDAGTRGSTWEAFWLPVQNIRVGLQYTAYTRYNGASDNYDGNGRNASDNNTLYLYVWAAY